MRPSGRAEPQPEPEFVPFVAGMPEELDVAELEEKDGEVSALVMVIIVVGEALELVAVEELVIVIIVEGVEVELDANSRDAPHTPLLALGFTQALFM